MSANILVAPGDCCGNPCPDPIVENIPGPQGTAGTNGTNGSAGVNAFTTTTANYDQPAVDANVAVTVANSTWAVVGQDVFINGGGYYTVISKADSTHMTVKNLGYDANSPAATVVPSGSGVGPAGEKGEDGSVDTGGALLAVNNLDDVDNVSTSLTNLGIPALLALRNLKTDNLSDVANAATARTNLGLAIGTNVQAFNAILADIAGLTQAINKMIYFDSATTAATTDLTSFARTLLDDTTAAAARATLGNVYPRYGLLGSLTAVDLNTTNTDNAIAIDATRYRIDKIVVDNASISLTTSTVGVFTAVAAGGTTVAATQALSALTATTKFDDLSLEAVIGTDVLTATTIYFRTAAAQGAAATANVFVFGWVLQ